MKERKEVRSFRSYTNKRWLIITMKPYQKLSFLKRHTMILIENQEQNEFILVVYYWNRKEDRKSGKKRGKEGEWVSGMGRK